MHARRRLLSAALAVALIAAFPVSYAGAADVTIKIDNFTFDPPELKIPAGTAVTWINHDDIPHTVVATNKLFRSAPLDTDDKYSFTFVSPGTYEYFCSLHPHMKATIVVEASGQK